MAVFERPWEAGLFPIRRKGLILRVAAGLRRHDLAPAARLADEMLETGLITQPIEARGRRTERKCKKLAQRLEFFANLLASAEATIAGGVIEESSDDWSDVGGTPPEDSGVRDEMFDVAFTGSFDLKEQFEALLEEFLRECGGKS